MSGERPKASRARRAARNNGSAVPRPLPADLYDWANRPRPKLGRPPKHDLAGWRVTDDWPERVPVTEAELDVFEAWFGDVLDELFGPE